MSSTVVDNIGTLVTNDAVDDADPLGLRRDAAVVFDGAQVAWVGPSRDAPAADRRVDAGGAAVLPGFVDSHTHLVFAGDRAAEFEARMAGRPYTTGGILDTVRATRVASDDLLRATVRRLRGEALRQGTTTLECKSGYGLTVPDEVRSVRLAAAEADEATFLGAHVVPPEYRDDADGYVRLVCEAMLPACAPHVRWLDVFCDRGAFDGEQTRTLLQAGVAYGLALRLHANQLGPGPGVQLAVEYGAASADHCTHLDDGDVAALAGSATVATLLPLAEFATRSAYPDARRLLAAGATVALATDCNPGTAYSTSMPLCIALAVREMGLTPAQAVWAATAGGARALRRDDVGVLRPGARADAVLLDAPSYVHLAYRPGVPIVAAVWQGGVRRFPGPTSAASPTGAAG